MSSPDKTGERLEEKKAFLQELRHEINTPLAVIKGYTELIQEKLGESMDPELKRYLEVIMRNIERLEASTKKVLENQD